MTAPPIFYGHEPPGLDWEKTEDGGGLPRWDYKGPPKFFVHDDATSTTFTTPSWSRCQDCGATGFKSIRRVGGRLIFWCRRGHPRHIIGYE